MGGAIWYFGPPLFGHGGGPWPLGPPPIYAPAPTPPCPLRFSGKESWDKQRGPDFSRSIGAQISFTRHCTYIYDHLPNPPKTSVLVGARGSASRPPPYLQLIPQGLVVFRFKVFESGLHNHLNLWNLIFFKTIFFLIGKLFINTSQNIAYFLGQNKIGRFWRDGALQARDRAIRL